MKKIKRKIDYPYVLDYKPGFFLGSFLYRLFKKVNLDPNMKEELKRLQRHGTVVYANKYPGLLDYLVYHFTFRSKRLPYPKIAFDLNIMLILPFGRLVKVIISQVSSIIRYGKVPSPYKTGFYASAVKKRIPSLISLVDPEGFIRSFVHSEKDHLHFLLEIQQRIDRPIFIVPQLILFKKAPEKDSSSLFHIFFGYKDHIGVIRKITLFFRYYATTFIDFGKPLDLSEYLKGQPQGKPIDEMAIEIRQLLIERIDNQKRIIIGPIMKSRQQLKEIVLRDRNIIELIKKIGEGDIKKLKQNRKKAGKYFDEIAADYSNTYVQIFRKILKWLWKRIFEGIDIDPAGAAKVREWARKGTLVYIPSHKSHIDYLALNCALYDYHVHIPRIAAGQNLAFWPMGHIFRKSGAFFIRRTFKGAKLYSEVFTRYIKALMEEGHPIEFYIEGGRSRNGKLVLPKIGFLSILIQAYREGYGRDLIFVPISIIYDRILEENAYLKEMGGAKKEKENIFQIIKARRLLKRKYGKIYIRFNEPFSLDEYFNQKGPDKQDDYRGLAFHLVDSINRVTLVTPLSLIAMAILTNHRRGFYIYDLEESINIILDFLKKMEIPLSDTLADPSKAVTDTLLLLINWKIVNSMEDAPEEEDIFYFVEDEKKLELEYYKNSIIHAFIHHSFVAVSFLTGMEEKRSIGSVVNDYLFLKDLFEKEFIFTEEDIQTKILSIIEYFTEAGYIEYSDENREYKITRLGFDKLPIWASLTKTFLESYWVTAKAMGNKKYINETKEILLRHITFLGKRYHKLGIIEHIEALSRINFMNAIETINKRISNNHDRSEEKDEERSEKLSHLTKKIYEFSAYGQ